MLQGYENADASRREIDRPDQRDEQNKPICIRQREGEPCRDHQPGCSDEKIAMVYSCAEDTDRQFRERRAEEREGRDYADLKCAEPDGSQIDRQQHGDEAITEIA